MGATSSKPTREIIASEFMEVDVREIECKGDIDYTLYELHLLSFLEELYKTGLINEYKLLDTKERNILFKATWKEPDEKSYELSLLTNGNVIMKESKGSEAMNNNIKGVLF